MDRYHQDFVVGPRIAKWTFWSAIIFVILIIPIASCNMETQMEKKSGAVKTPATLPPLPHKYTAPEVAKIVEDQVKENSGIAIWMEKYATDEMKKEVASLREEIKDQKDDVTELKKENQNLKDQLKVKTADADKTSSDKIDLGMELRKKTVDLESKTLETEKQALVIAEAKTRIAQLEEQLSQATQKKEPEKKDPEAKSKDEEKEETAKADDKPPSILQRPPSKSVPVFLVNRENKHRFDWIITSKETKKVYVVNVGTTTDMGNKEVRNLAPGEYTVKFGGYVAGTPHKSSSSKSKKPSSPVKPSVLEFTVAEKFVTEIDGKRYHAVVEY